MSRVNDVRTGERHGLADPEHALVEEERSSPPAALDGNRQAAGGTRDKS